MLRTGLQGFHGGRIAMPRRPQDQPDPQRLGCDSSASRWRLRDGARRTAIEPLAGVTDEEAMDSHAVTNDTPGGGLR